MNIEELKATGIALEQALAQEFEEISHFIFTHPELGGEEFTSSAHLCAYLQKNGFFITAPYGSQQTAFRAEYGDEDGPVLAFLAEYDALPGYGPTQSPAHACGHNWIAAATVGISVVLSKLKDHFSGKIVLIGTPAEETYNGKALLVAEGAFKDVDIVLQPHLENQTNTSIVSLAMDSLFFRFHGKATHASATPHLGINALDAVQLTFAGINALRQHVKPDVRIHGIITKGGEAANITPDLAECHFYVRAEKRSDLDEVTRRVIECAKGASIMTGTSYEVCTPDQSVDDIINLPTLQKITRKSLIQCGIHESRTKHTLAPGSSDIGNVSHVCPTMYVEIALDAAGSLHIHEASALQYVDSPQAYVQLHRVIQALVNTSLDLYTTPTIVQAAQRELTKRLSTQKGRL